MRPHQYQDDYLADIRKALLEFMRILVVSPTGSGKTCMFSWLVQEFERLGMRVLILVDQDELVWQTVNKIRQITGIEAQVEKAEHRANLDAVIVVGSVQTMARRCDRWPANHFQVVIADEADKSITPQWQSVLNHFDKCAKVIGFTATPHRTDKKNLGVYYENAIERENLFSLIHKGFLSPISIQMFPVNINMSGASTRSKDFSDDEVDEIITPHLEELARAVQQYGSFRRTLVFLPLVKTCEKFTEIGRDIGMSADFVHGMDPERDSKLSRFKRWDFDVLANSMLLTRGVDIPEVDCIAPFRFTKSITLYMQIVGRGTRLAPGKTDCLLLDPLYQASKRLVCNPAHLIAKNDEEAEQITKLAQDQYAGMPSDIASQLDLVELGVEATSQREASLRKKLEEQKNKKAKTISAEEFAMQHNSMDTAEFEPTMGWEALEISPKQLKYIKLAGIDPGTVKGKGHASKLLGLYFANKQLKMASHGQRSKMKQMGYPGWENATESEARQFFAGLNKRKEPQFL